jgi:predicted DNA-binding protein
MTPITKTFTFALPDDMKAGLQVIKERDGITEAEQIRRAIAKWLNEKGVVTKTERKRAVTRKRS